MDPTNTNHPIFRVDDDVSSHSTTMPLFNYDVVETPPTSIAHEEECLALAPTGYIRRPYPTPEYVGSDLGASSTSHSEHSSSRQVLVPPNEMMSPWNRNDQHYLPETQQRGLALHTSALQSDPELLSTIRNPDPKLQYEFLQFLMENHLLLNSITNPTEEAIAAIQVEFTKEIRRRVPVPPFLDIQRIVRQFRPVGSAATRQQSDNRTKTQARNIKCPFSFCEGHFTRLAGLRNHLSGHFSLTPNQCLRCGKCFSDAAIKRHEDSCTWESSSRLEI